MTDQARVGPRLLDRIDFLTLAGAIVTLFVALGAEPWWTLGGAGNNRLFNVQVSPFYLHITAIGMPNTVPLANILGSLTRTLLLIGFLALFAASIRPTSWWRNLAIYYGVGSLIELYLSFVLTLYWAQGVFVNAYSVAPPYYGTTHLQANVVGLDLNLYSSPLVTATFGLPYYLGLISLGLILGKTITRLIHYGALRAFFPLLPGGSIRSVYFTPPYQQVWFSSGDRQFNPLQIDPQSQTDDELLSSFGELYEKVEPGGVVTIMVPASATLLGKRLEKLIPQAGFRIEESPEKSENELRFMKPSPRSSPMIEQTLSKNVGQTFEEVSPPTPVPPMSDQQVFLAPYPPQALEVTEEPKSLEPRMTRLEKTILKEAVKIITERREAVQYRDLLNQVYMELVDHKVEFESARQIEATLLSHNGSEIQLIEQEDDSGLPTLKKWDLSKRKMIPDRRRLATEDTVREAGSKLPRLTRIFQRRHRSHYKPNPENDEDPGQ